MRKRNNQNIYLTIEQKRKVLIKDGRMPTAIFSADKSGFIVKPRGTIFGKAKRRKRRSII